MKKSTQTTSEATVVPLRLEVAEERRGGDADFAPLPSQISVRGLDFFHGKKQALLGNKIEILMDGESLLSSQADQLDLRRRVGMIIRKPSPFPMTVFDNGAYGLRQHCKMSRSESPDRVEHALKSRYTIVLVTHNMQQAARVGDYTAIFFQGYIVEFGPTTQIFSNPAQKQTEEYITGRFG